MPPVRDPCAFMPAMFGTRGHDLPSRLDAGGFVLEPLTVDHVELDYAAVMDSRDMLRIWSGTSWPADDFTLAENREDLERHQREHTEGTAFTFTVLSPDGSECLGCVYVNPTDRFIPSDDLVGSVEGLPEGTAVVGFWVRQSRRDGDLEGRLLESLVGWLRESWDFPAVLVSVAGADARQRDVVESAGLAERLRVGAVGRAGEWVLYGS